MRKRRPGKTGMRDAQDNADRDWTKIQEQRLTNYSYTEAEEGYGQPSRGSYSMDMGGYKTFGTSGQGNLPQGAKDEGSETCSDRMMMVQVTATKDTTATPVVSSVSPHSRHPRVLQSTSSATMTVGNYQFLDDVYAAL